MAYTLFNRSYLSAEAVDVEGQHVEDSESFATEAYAGRITVRELRLTTFIMAMQISEN